MSFLNPKFLIQILDIDPGLQGSLSPTIEDSTDFKNTIGGNINSDGTNAFPKITNLPRGINFEATSKLSFVMFLATMIVQLEVVLLLLIPVTEMLW